jgi:undecaprenyl-diphosphatase
MRPRFQRITGWLRNLDLFVLLAGLALVVGVLAFLLIADAVRGGGTQSMDEAIIRSLRRPDDLATPIGPTWLLEVGRDLTALGGVTVLSLVTAAVVGFLAILRANHAMWLVLAATLGGLLLSTVLKQSFDRPRPDLVPHLSQVYTSSFPSGHSMLSATVYLTLGALLARLVQRVWLKLYFVAVALLVTFLVGCSRVYMGVHYPTDVLAGWCAGLSW